MEKKRLRVYTDLNDLYPVARRDGSLRISLSLSRAKKSARESWSRVRACPNYPEMHPCVLSFLSCRLASTNRVAYVCLRVCVTVSRCALRKAPCRRMRHPQVRGCILESFRP